MGAWDPRDVIAAKRDGRTLSSDDVRRLVGEVASGGVTDAQAAAFLMAALIRGLDADETLAMTEAMIASGELVTFGDLGLRTVDKHSTGGVADGVTLVFAPVAAAMGLGVAKLSGRGLGHTGGTLDKLEAIPGLRTDLSPDEIARQVEEVGCAVAAQSARVVPADGALYALRDATATVPSIPLIAASVMSKKLAVSTDLILLDVKAGSGAFMRTADDADRLASACLELARGAGRRCGVAVTDMSQPLGDAVGNALDVIEAVEILRGERRGRLRELVEWFAARAAAALEGISTEDGAARAATVLDDGSALERFGAMVETQGGDRRVVDTPADVVPGAPLVSPIVTPSSGWLASTDAEEIGMAASGLGAGRIRKGDPVDPSVGIVLRAKIGDRVEEGQPMGEVHARNADDAGAAASRVLAALHLSEGEVDAPPLVHRWLEPEEG